MCELRRGMDGIYLQDSGFEGSQLMRRRLDGGSGGGEEYEQGEGEEEEVENARNWLLHEFLVIDILTG